MSTAPVDRDPSVAAELRAIGEAGLRRQLRVTDVAEGCRVTVDGRSAISFGSCDYLGLATDARLARAASEAAATHGSGAGAARLLTGHGSPAAALEAELAQTFSTPAALVFGSGYLANLGVITALAGPGDLIVSDRLNHASTVDACRLSGATTRVVGHNDLVALQAALVDADDFRRVVVLVEGVYSMDGDEAPLADVVDVAKRAAGERAFVVVDDAHGLGTRGPGGRGSCAAHDVTTDVSVQIGNLGKALGSYGAFVLADEDVRDLLVQRARSFIFTCALPPAVLAAARAGLAVLRDDPEPLARLRRNVVRLDRALREAGLGDELVPGAGHAGSVGVTAGPASVRAPVSGEVPIVPVALGSSERALAVAARMLAAGWLTPAVRPPTVPAGGSRLRLTVTAAHADDHIDGVAAALADALAGEPCGAQPRPALAAGPSHPAH